MTIDDQLEEEGEEDDGKQASKEEEQEMAEANFMAWGDFDGFFGGGGKEGNVLVH
jgi:hypothetical protein